MVSLPPFIIFAISILGIWLAILGSHTLLQLFLGQSYLTFLSHLGLTISPFKGDFYTSAAARRAVTLTRRFPRSTQILYALGGLLAIPLALVSIGIQVYSIFRHLAYIVTYIQQHVAGGQLLEDAPSSILVPILPGFTVPFSHTPHILAALLISGIVHELGHLLAAAQVGAKVRGFGLSVVGFLPAAYVDLEDDLPSLPPRRALRVASAGVWHNVLLALVLIAAVSLMGANVLPMPYAQRGQMIVTAVAPEYEGAIQVGDVLEAVDGHPVKSTSDWMDRLASYYSNGFTQTVGFCINENRARERQGDACCHEKEVGDDLCWRFPLLPSLVSCAPPRFLSIADAPLCSNQSNSGLHQSEIEEDQSETEANQSESKSGSACPSSLVCAVPALQGELLLRLTIRSPASVSPALILAHPYSLLSAVELSEWQVRGWETLPSWLRRLAAPVPVHLSRLTWYIISLSAGLALLNALPVSPLDGTYILRALYLILTGDKEKKKTLETNEQEKEKEREREEEVQRVVEKAHWASLLLIGVSVLAAVVVYFLP